MENKKPRIDLGDRELQIGAENITVLFSPERRIDFVDRHETLLLSLDPTELSIVYGAYMQMREELGE